MSRTFPSMILITSFKNPLVHACLFFQIALETIILPIPKNNCTKIYQSQWRIISFYIINTEIFTSKICLGSFNSPAQVDINELGLT